MQRDCSRESTQYLDLPEGDEDAVRTVTLADAQRLPGRSSPVVADRNAPWCLGVLRCDTPHDRTPCLLDYVSPLALRDRFGGRCWVQTV